MSNNTDTMQKFINAFQSHYGRLPTEDEMMILVKGMLQEGIELLSKLQREMQSNAIDESR